MAGLIFVARLVMMILSVIDTSVGLGPVVVTKTNVKKMNMTIRSVKTGRLSEVPIEVEMMDND